MKSILKGTYCFWLFVALAIYSVMVFVGLENPNKYYFKAKYYWPYQAEQASEIHSALRIIAEQGEEFKREFTPDPNLKRAVKTIDATFIFRTNHPVRLTGQAIHLENSFSQNSFEDFIMVKHHASVSDYKLFDASNYLGVDLYGFQKQIYSAYVVESPTPGITHTEQRVDSDLVLYTSQPELQPECVFEGDWSINIGVTHLTSVSVGDVVLVDGRGNYLDVDACQRHVTMLFPDETYFKLTAIGLSQRIIQDFEETFSQDQYFYAGEELTVLSWSVNVFKLLLDHKIDANWINLEEFVRRNTVKSSYERFQYDRSFRNANLNKGHSQFLRKAWLYIIPLTFLFFASCVQLYVNGFDRLRTELLYPFGFIGVIARALANIREEKKAVRESLAKDKAERQQKLEEADAARQAAIARKDALKTAKRESEKGLAHQRQIESKHRILALRAFNLAEYEQNVEIPIDLINALRSRWSIVENLDPEFDPENIAEVEAEVAKVDVAKKAIEKFLNDLGITKGYMLDCVDDALHRADYDPEFSKLIDRRQLLEWQAQIPEPRKPSEWKKLVYEFDKVMERLKPLLEK